MARPDAHAGGPARVLIVDDHPVVRAGLKAHLDAQEGIEVCGEADATADALALAARARPDVAVVDVLLRAGDGIDLTRRLTAGGGAVRVVVWSMYPGALYAERALAAGASGYVHKCAPTGEIVAAVRAVLAGRVFLSGDVSSDILGRLVGRDGRADLAPLDSLSDRELQVFRSVGLGQTTAQIADGMHLSPKTVETYRARIKAKLGITSFTELVQRAAQWVAANG